MSSFCLRRGTQGTQAERVSKTFWRRHRRNDADASPRLESQYASRLSSFFLPSFHSLGVPIAIEKNTLMRRMARKLL